LNYPNNTYRLDNQNITIINPFDYNLDFINITFNKPINLGNGQLRINQKHHNISILRQFFTKDTIINDIDSQRNTITLKILKSTFNIPNSSYTIEFEKNFILSKFISTTQIQKLTTGK